MTPLRSALAALAAAAILPLAGGATPAAGLYGVVTKGPVAPVCRVGEPCEAPAQVTLLFARNGAIRKARSGSDGRYRIALAPGVYSVSTLERIGIGRNITPARVKVRRARYDRVDFHIDTGIR